MKERLSRPGAARLVAIAALFSAMVVVPKGAQAQTSTILVSNIEQESYGFTLLSLIDAAQGFTTGNSSATLKSIDVKFSGAPNSTVSVKLATGLPGGTTEVATLTNPSSFRSGNLRFTAPDSTTLSANTQYWVVVSAENAHAGNSWITTSASDAEDSGGQTGWSMADDRYWRTVGSTTWVNTTLFGHPGDNVFMIRVNGTVDTPPTTNPPPTNPTPPTQPPPSQFLVGLNNLGASHSVVDGKAVMHVTWTRSGNIESIEHFEYRVREGYYEDSEDFHFGSEVIPWTRVNKSEDGVTIEGLSPEVRCIFSVRSVYGNRRSSALWINLPVIPPLPVSVFSEDDELPAEVTLGQNYPNPFNPETAIDYALAQAGHVRLAVYDMTGRTVTVLVDGVRPQGRHAARFHADGLPTGTYVYRLTTEAETLTRAMTLVR